MMAPDALPFLLFAFVVAILLLGYPVAFALAGGSLLFAFGGHLAGVFESAFLFAIPERVYGIMRNETLIAVPLFVFMGVALERGKISENLLVAMGRLFGELRGGLAVSVCVVGAILAASTGIVGATVVTMGLISLPVMLRHKYDPAFACGVITASGTLGQIIPPSIVLVLLGDVISNANQKARLAAGDFSPDTVSVGDLFFGALLPGLMLVGMYVVYAFVFAWLRPQKAPAMDSAAPKWGEIARALLPPLALILCVLGSILHGVATPTEAAAVGAVGALALIACGGGLSWTLARDAARKTARITAMVFSIFIGAALFSLTFRGFGGDEAVIEILDSLPGGPAAAFLAVMALIFVLGFFLDFIEIVFVVVPIVAPALLGMGIDPVWLGVMIALNLQTSFLTPPFGFALFYLRGVAPPEVTTAQIYKGAAPFVVLQALLLVALWFAPEAATWLPRQVYR